jgi:pSer/pThr/pTyr-binding forkhead associated (FHA) protein
MAALADAGPSVGVRAESRSEFATMTDRSTGVHYELTGERVVLGRLKACDICLQDRIASREHAALEREGAGWVLLDLGSTNGTLVNDEDISRVRLRDGDVITIGVTELDFREAGVAL